MQRLLGVRDKEATRNLLTLMRENHKVKDGTPVTMYHGYMPPVVGKDAELDALATYLATLNAEKPSGGHEMASTPDNKG